MAERRPPPWDLLLIVTGALLLVAQARLHVFIPGIGVLRPGLLLLVLGAAVWIFKTNPIQRLGRPLPFGVKLALFLFAWAAISVPFALWVGQSARAITGSFGTTILVFLLVVASVRHTRDVQRLLVVFGIGGALFGVLAPLQDRMRARGFGAGGYDPNDSAMYLVSALPVLVYFAVSARRLHWRVASGISALTVIGAIVSTASRGGFLGLAAVLIFLLLFFKGIKPLMKVAVVTIVLLGLFTTADADYWERMESIAEMDDGYGSEEGAVGGRLQIWERGVGYMLSNPLTGVGVFNFPVAEGQSPVIAERIARGIGTKYSAAHSMWIQVGAETGIPGISAFLLLFGYVSRGLWRLSKRNARGHPDPGVPMMASTILGVLVGVAVAGSFLSNAYWAMVWAPIGLGVALIKVGADRSQPRRASSVGGGKPPLRDLVLEGTHGGLTRNHAERR